MPKVGCWNNCCSGYTQISGGVPISGSPWKWKGGLGFDNRLIVLRQQGRIFINFATLGRGDSTVFSMGIINYYRSRQVKKRFREYLAA